MNIRQAEAPDAAQDDSFRPVAFTEVPLEDTFWLPRTVDAVAPPK